MAGTERDRQQERDATRAEAVLWCAEKQCDFREPVFPPPEGWMWGRSGPHLVLTPVFTNTSDADITRADVVQGGAA